jgi:hypothetical protein
MTIVAAPRSIDQVTDLAIVLNRADDAGAAWDARALLVSA